MPDTVTEEVLKLPDVSNVEALEDFIRQVEQLANSGKRGARTLHYSLTQFVKIRHYAEKHLERAIKNLNSVNGVRTVSQKGGDKARSLRNTAEKFYNMQTTAGLRQHCKLFGIDFDSYDNIDDVVAALVNQHLAMQSG